MRSALKPVWLAAFFSFPFIAHADEPQWKKFATLTDAPQYGDHFAHYDYVNAKAPKGGTLNAVSVGTFDSLNPYIVAGAPAAGFLPIRGGLLYDVLMDPALDQGGVSYPSVASAIMSAPDYSWVKFKINSKAYWHDGKPITPEDVVWSFKILSTYSPYYKAYYADVDHAEIVGPNKDEVKFFFKSKGNRELPVIMGDLVVLPKHWWEGTDANGHKRDVTKPTLEIPLGSGPYKIKSFVPGKSIVWEKVDNYWGKDLPQNVGRNNYQDIKYTYLRDENAEWEAFKKGGVADYREEKSIQRWMQEYTFPAANEGHVLKASYPNIKGAYQAYYLNTRLPKFADIRVRKALFLAMDFDSINKTIYFNKYARLHSYYGYEGLAATPLPDEKEKKVLELVRKDVPEELFTKEFVWPTYNSPADRRKNLNAAMGLLREAGYHLESNHLVDKNGQPFTIEFLLSSSKPFQEQPTALYAASLRHLGIDTHIRKVDQAQYLNRRINYDYDVVFENVDQSNSPGNEQLEYFSSSYAKIPGGRNYSGVSSPAMDKLTDHLIHAQTREEVTATARAIDRVLLWNYYSVPAWEPRNVDVAYWDKIGFPETQPAYKGFDFLSGWVNPTGK